MEWPTNAQSQKQYSLAYSYAGCNKISPFQGWPLQKADGPQARSAFFRETSIFSGCWIGKNWGNSPIKTSLGMVSWPIFPKIPWSWGVKWSPLPNDAKNWHKQWPIGLVPWSMNAFRDAFPPFSVHILWGHCGHKMGKFPYEIAHRGGTLSLNLEKGRKNSSWKVTADYVCQTHTK